MNYNEMSDIEWCQLLLEQPALADQCNWDIFGGWGWCLLLKEQPQYAEFCNWDKLGGETWMALLMHQPQFARLCRWELLSHGCWLLLTSQQPEILNNLSKQEQRQAIIANKEAIQYIDNPDEELVRVHKVKHEL